MENKKKDKKEIIEESIDNVNRIPKENLNIGDNEDLKISERKRYVALIIIFINLIIVTMSLIALGIGIVSNINNKKETPPKEEPNEEQNTPVEDPIPDEEKKYELVVYNNGGEYSEEKKYDTSVVIATIPTETTDAKFLDTSKNYYNEENYHILYKDNNKIKIYDVVGKTSTVTSLSAKYEEYNLVYEIKTGKITGIGYYKDKTEENYYKSYTTSGFYNLFTGKTLYKNKYDKFTYVDDELIFGTKKVNENEIKHELLSNKKEKTYITSLGNQDDYYGVIGNNNYISFTHEYHFDKGPSDIYTKDYKLIAKEVGGYLFDFDKEGNISIATNNKIEKYTTDGIKIKETKEYNKVLHVIKDFYLVTLNGNLLLTNGDDLEIILGTWDDSYYYHSTISGYYEEGELNNENEEGIYLIVQTDELLFEGTEYYFNPDTKEVKESPLSAEENIKSST